MVWNLTIYFIYRKLLLHVHMFIQLNKKKSSNLTYKISGRCVVYVHTAVYKTQYHQFSSEISQNIAGSIHERLRTEDNMLLKKNRHCNYMCVSSSLCARCDYAIGDSIPTRVCDFTYLRCVNEQPWTTSWYICRSRIHSLTCYRI